MVRIESGEPLQVGFGSRRPVAQLDLVNVVHSGRAGRIVDEDAFARRDPGHPILHAIAVDIEGRGRTAQISDVDALLGEVKHDRSGIASAVAEACAGIEARRAEARRAVQPRTQATIEA
jgi:hypothetical protein